MFPERFSNLPAYAFPRLRALLDHHPAGGETVHMTIGEPKHPFPTWVGEELAAHIKGFNSYPPNDGSEALLTAISGWLKSRFSITAAAIRKSWLSMEPVKAFTTPAWRSCLRRCRAIRPIS